MKNEIPNNAQSFEVVIKWKLCAIKNSEAQRGEKRAKEE
jgi:hypothetical protein